MKHARRLNLFVFALIVATGLSLAPGRAHAESFLTLIERPIARFLLTETRQGRSLVNQILGRSGAGAIA